MVGLWNVARYDKVKVLKEYVKATNMDTKVTSGTRDKNHVVTEKTGKECSKACYLCHADGPNKAETAVHGYWLLSSIFPILFVSNSVLSLLPLSP